LLVRAGVYGAGDGKSGVGIMMVSVMELGPNAIARK
jgi:hypothetical protein